MIYRQGDVLLKSIQSIPSNAKRKNLVLAEGEITGHLHQFIDQANVSVYEANNIQFVQVTMDSDLIHDEHETLIVAKGLYEVVQQQEVDLLNEIRKVID